MLGILEDILDVFENIPAYILFAIESLINIVFAGVQLLLEAAAAILPGMPEVVTPPAYLSTINWFFPLGAVLSIASTIVTAYIVFLGVRYIWRKYGAI